MTWYAELFTVFAALFSVVNPLGAMPVFLSLTKEDSPQDRARTAFRTSIYFVIILLVSFFAGIYILQFFGISMGALRIAGGIIILSSGFALLSGEHEKNRTIDKKVKSEAQDRNDISLTPLAIPLLAGPGSISLLIAQFQEDKQWTDYSITVLSLMLMAIVTFLILRFSSAIVGRLGQAGMNSISRIIGFIVMAVGVQYLINGLMDIVVQNRELLQDVFGSV